MSKRVAIFTSTYNNIYSGVGTYARLIVESLLSIGYEITVFSPDCDDNPPNFVKIKKPSIKLSPNSWLELAYIYNNVLSNFSKKFDVIHFLDAREGFFVRKNIKALFIGSVHDTYSWDLQSRAILKEYFLDWKVRLIYYTLLYNLEKRAYKKFDLLISNTNYVRDRLKDFYDAEEKKVETVYIPVPSDDIKELQNDRKYSNIISFVGGNFQRKGLLQLVKAVKMLRDEGLPLKIVVAGRDNNQRLIEKWIKDNKYEGIVEFRGHLKRNEVFDLLDKSDVFAMPSITEAFGLVYLEAMCRGIPVIGSAQGGTKELIIDGWNGYLANPYDVANIAEKIKLALDRLNRIRLIKNGFTTVENFNKNKFIDDMRNIYSSIW